MKTFERLFFDYASAYKAMRGAFLDGYNVKIETYKDADGDVIFRNTYWKKDEKTIKK